MAIDLAISTANEGVTSILTKLRGPVRAGGPDCVSVNEVYCLRAPRGTVRLTKCAIIYPK